MDKKARLLAVLFLLVPLAITFASGSSAKSGAGKPRTFAIIYPVIHPVFESCDNGAKDKAREMGVNVIIQDPDVADPAQQIQIVEKLIAQKVDGIAIGPADSTKWCKK
jgi:ribose transport system substrate-binding protein